MAFLPYLPLGVCGGEGATVSFLLLSVDPVSALHLVKVTALATLWFNSQLHVSRQSVPSW